MNIPMWAKKPKHKSEVIATPRGWMVKETGEYLKMVNNLSQRLVELKGEVSKQVEEIDKILDEANDIDVDPTTHIDDSITLNTEDDKRIFSVDLGEGVSADDLKEKLQELTDGLAAPNTEDLRDFKEEGTEHLEIGDVDNSPELEITKEDTTEVIDFGPSDESTQKGTLVETLPSEIPKEEPKPKKQRGRPRKNKSTDGTNK